MSENFTITLSEEQLQALDRMIIDYKKGYPKDNRTITRASMIQISIDFLLEEF